MLSKYSAINGNELQGLGDSIGTLRDLLFDPDRWIVRFLVIDSGSWLTGRKVLLPPAKVDVSDGSGDQLFTDLSREQVENGPPIDQHRPVSREMESKLFKYYGVPFYWGPAGTALAGSGPPPIPLASEQSLKDQEGDGRVNHQLDRPQLRSAEEVTDYRVSAIDGEIGHIQDLVIDDRDWSIAYLVGNTRNWLPGKEILLSPEEISRISWADASVSVKLTREQVKESPTVDSLGEIADQSSGGLLSFLQMQGSSGGEQSPA